MIGRPADEKEWDSALGQQISECYCKADYLLSDVPSGKSLDDCHHYTIWEPGAPHDQHWYDSQWDGATGPIYCGKFKAESVQSVATVSLDGYANTIIAAASPSRYEFANGYLTFYDATTLSYLGCAEAGVKPEGIASTATGAKVACLNEGSASSTEEMRCANASLAP